MCVSEKPLNRGCARERPENSLGTTNSRARMYIKACAQCQGPTGHPIPLSVVRVTIAVSAHVTHTYSYTYTHARTHDGYRSTDRPTDYWYRYRWCLCRGASSLAPVSDFVLTPSQCSYYAIDNAKRKRKILNACRVCVCVCDYRLDSESLHPAI